MSTSDSLRPRFRWIGATATPAKDASPGASAAREQSGVRSVTSSRSSEDFTQQPPELRALFEQHYASMWRLLRRLGVAPAQLDDATQEVFWVAARRLSDIQPGSEHAFLYGVALRVAADEIRRSRAGMATAQLDDALPIADDSPSPEERLDQQRARELLDWVLDRMPHELRTVLVLFELEGLEVQQIADIERIPLGTASSRLRRAREEFSAIARRLRARRAVRRENLP